IKLYFEETPFEEWSLLHFLETFNPVILSNLESTKRQDKGTWVRRFKERLEKISADEAYSDQEKDRAMHLSNEVMTASLPRAVPVGVIQPKDGFAPSQGDNGFVPLNHHHPSSVDTFFDVIERKTKFYVRGERQRIRYNSLKRKSDGSDEYDIANITEVEVKFSMLDAEELFDVIACDINITTSLPDDVKQYLEELLSGDIVSALGKLDKPLVDNPSQLLLWTREVSRHFIFYYHYGGLQVNYVGDDIHVVFTNLELYWS
ncbi:6161_t:CDS:2, partial [Gigaspora rosea]